MAAEDSQTQMVAIEEDATQPGPGVEAGVTAASFDIYTPEADSSCNVLGFYSAKRSKPNPEFSNFFQHREPFQFTLPSYAQREGFPRSVWCSFSEKAIMVTKAALMGDLETFMRIDKAKDPASCKALGREVRNWDEALWHRHLEETAFEVVRQKFESDRELGEKLLSTGNKILAEASPSDCIWGIGLGVTDPRVSDPTQWQGRNILGFALMRTRDHLHGDGRATAAAVAAAAARRACSERESAIWHPGGEVAADSGEAVAATGEQDAGDKALAAEHTPTSQSSGSKDAA